MNIRELKTNDDLELGYGILHELRTDLSFQDFSTIYEAAHRSDQYTMVGMFNDENKCVAMMGYRVLHDFVHGKHLYIDDLVVSSTQRSQGLGEKLLRHAEQLAPQFGCKKLRLCTGTQNKGAMRFYERCGWELKSVVYKTAVPEKAL